MLQLVTTYEFVNLMTRIVFYGHASFATTSTDCTIPTDTSLTIYCSPGSLLNQDVSNALANGELLTAEDISVSKATWYFIKNGLKPTDKPGHNSFDTYPLILKAGDNVPDYVLSYADIPAMNPPLNQVPTQVVQVRKKTSLSQLLNQYKGQDLHWGACGFAQNFEDIRAVGYGYAFSLKPDSALKNNYQPPKPSEEEKKIQRLKRFSSFFTVPDEPDYQANRSNKKTRYTTGKNFSPSESKQPGCS
ncbi:putative adhesin [Legionella genomosp. 1]|uniref:putative adhesin n=1 Tax=Legionella genomosp. 1 TaxID=1093625 RepID=UPI0013EF648A|nr:hypothetical protein [Legionella genomosp. 1]